MQYQYPSRLSVMARSLMIATFLTLVGIIANGSRDEILALTKAYPEVLVTAAYIATLSVFTAIVQVLSFYPLSKRREVVVIALTLNTMAALIGLSPWFGFHLDLYQVPIVILWIALSGKSKSLTWFPVLDILVLWLAFGLFLAFSL